MDRDQPGAAQPHLQTEAARLKTIHEAGRPPLQRNTYYEPIRVLGNAPAAEATENPARSKMLEDNLATA